MNNPFHIIVMVAVCALVSAGVSWGVYLSGNPAPSRPQDVSLNTPLQAWVAPSQGSASAPTVITVYPPTHDNPSYHVVITQLSSATQIHPIVVVPQ